MALRNASPFVFISYSHHDEELALLLSQRLNRAHIPHFMDKSSIEWGDDIPDAVHDALDRTTHLFVLVSPGSQRSQWVAYEMGYARGKGITIIPYVSHPAMELPGFIVSKRYLRNSEDISKFIRGLRRRTLATLDNAQGQMKWPRANSTVKPEIRCRGNVTGLGAGMYLRLVLEVDGLHWPKEQVQPNPDWSWEATVFEDGRPINVDHSPKQFAISLFALAPSAERKIDRWHKRGRASNHYPGLQGIPGGRRICRVSGLKLAERYYSIPS